MLEWMSDGLWAGTSVGVGTLLSGVVSRFFWPSPPMWVRANAAYAGAWGKVGGAPTDDNVEVLVKQLQQEGTYWAYTDPYGPLFTPWHDLWRRSVPPKEARRLAEEQGLKKLYQNPTAWSEHGVKQPEWRPQPPRRRFWGVMRK